MYSIKGIFAAALATTLMLAAGALNAGIPAVEKDHNQGRNHGSLDQGGDNAATAIIVPSLPFCDTGTTVGYTNDYSPSCLASLNGPDVVYRYTPTTTSNVVFSFCGSSYENVCHVWNTVPSQTGAPFLCAHSNCGNSACASFNAAAGTAYYIVLDGQYGASGAYQLNANVGSTCQNTPCTAVNDLCADAILLPNTGNFAGTTAGATLDNVPYCSPNGQPSGPGVWYRVVGQGRLVTMSVPYAAFPARLGLYCGDCTCMSCYDQTNDCNTDSLTVCLSTGVTYCILVSSCDGSTGNFTLTLSQQSSLCTPTIACTSSLESPLAAPGTRSGNTCGECNDCSLRSSPEVVVPVEIPNDGWWVISLCQSTFNTYMYVGTTPCTGNIYANDDTCGVQSLSPCLHLGARTYFVTIEGNVATACGNYVLDVFPCPPPENDDCENAIGLSIPGTFTGTTVGATMDEFPTGQYCDPAIGPGVWYKFTGHDRTAAVQMTTYLTHTFTFFYEACCGRLNCYYQGTCGQPQGFGMCANSGTCTYYLLVSACNTLGGPFTFTITEGNNCSPSLCGVYEHIVSAPGEVSGSSCGKCNDCDLGPGENITARFAASTTETYDISCVTDFPAMMYVGTGYCSQDVYASPDCGLSQSTGPLILPVGWCMVTLEPCDPQQCGNYTIRMLSAVAPASNLVIQWAAPASVQLNWGRSGSSVSGYKVYRALTPDVPTIPGNLIATTPDTFCVDAIPVSPEIRRFYTVTAVTP